MGGRVLNSDEINAVKEYLRLTDSYELTPLTDFIATIDQLNAHNGRLLEQKEQLTFAVEWYADEENYRRIDYGMPAGYRCPVQLDNGKRARDTLSRIKVVSG